MEKVMVKAMITWESASNFHDYSLSPIRKYWARRNEQTPSNEASLVSTNDRPKYNIIVAINKLNVI
ncbi:uncharacterized protein BX663DRAFT_514273, partial [Cokeromyces recurvatus]|uniref:uncharacterized protein n=1 Tax=Cokeromyces recurvatus TaxID=90255 RepID=UPI00221FD1D0